VDANDPHEQSEDDVGVAIVERPERRCLAGDDGGEQGVVRHNVGRQGLAWRCLAAVVRRHDPKKWCRGRTRLCWRVSCPGLLATLSCTAQSHACLIYYRSVAFRVHRKYARRLALSL